MGKHLFPLTSRLSVSMMTKDAEQRCVCKHFVHICRGCFCKRGFPFLPLCHSVFNLCTVSGVWGMELFPGDFLSNVILK